RLEAGRGASQTGQGRPGGGASSRTTEFVVVPDIETNSLLIAANRTRYQELLSLIQRLDQRQPQVLIETALIELSGRDFLDIGIELALSDIPNNGQDGGFGVTDFGLSTLADTDGDGIPDIKIPNQAAGFTAGILSGDNFNLPFLISMIQERRNSNVLNVPSVLVNNNGSATVTTKDEQPTTQITATGGIGGQTQENFSEYVEAGTTMTISPSISASGYLRLQISLEVSNFLGAVQGSIPPPRTTRIIETSVSVPDGDTMVIGGIILDNHTSTKQQIPILGDIPIIGRLFSRESDSLDRTALYFFVTPHILRDDNFADLAELSYQKKLEAADTIGADRVRLIDPDFNSAGGGIDLSGFDVPLFTSPSRGEIETSDIGLDPLSVNEMLEEGRLEEQDEKD
ncbi:MAG: type II secretion system protein GspD, partial [Planctomycetota bacterium]